LASIFHNRPREYLASAGAADVKRGTARHIASMRAIKRSSGVVTVVFLPGPFSGLGYCARRTGFDSIAANRSGSMQAFISLLG
jgi:hypothetical protein